MTISSDTKYLLDTNILVVWAIQTAPMHERAKLFFDKLAREKPRLAVSSQNLLEFSAVLTRSYKISPQRVADDINAFLNDPSLEIIYPNFVALDKFSGLLKTSKNIHVTDLFLVATAWAYNINTIITNDTDFLKIKEVKVFNPLA